MKKKILVPVVAMSMLVSAMVGGTLAYLMDDDTVTNTFTVGNVDIEIDETTGETYKMVPGVAIAKDPTVTVVDGSEPCWLFVEITDEAGLKNKGYLDYTIADGWTEYPAAGVTNATVYYRTVLAPVDDETETLDGVAPMPVLKKVHDGKELMVGELKTGDELESVSGSTLVFKAYAVQHDAVDTVADAWGKVKGN